MADTVSKHIDMTTGSLWRNIPLFAFPVAATSILEQLSNLIATVIIGNFSGDQGTLAMAAVGSNVPLTSLMLNLFIGMSLGSNVVIANAIGRNDQNMVKRAVHTSILMALVGFVVIALERDLCRAHARCAQRACRDHAARLTLSTRLFAEHALDLALQL